MVNHGVCRLDLMHGTNNPADLCSFKYYVSTTATAIDNGNIVVLDSLMTDNREVYKAVAPAVTSNLGQIALVASPELMYDETPRKTFADFQNEAGSVCRGHILRSGDIFSVTIDAVGGRATLAAVVVGDIVECAASTKLNIVATATSGSTVLGKVIAKEGNYIVIRID